ncbi:MAG: hypothetical protein NXH85_16060 [Pseudomonadaceae bacterium]|nr:hypothetical protein [Pseudomonadaceae bacterium]
MRGNRVRLVCAVLLVLLLTGLVLRWLGFTSAGGVLAGVALLGMGLGVAWLIISWGIARVERSLLDD